MLVRDAWRLAVGTLTAMPVPPPEHVDRRRAAMAMVVAPLAALPLALGAAAIALLGQLTGLPHLVTALLAIGVVVAGNRALHLDGLADTVDGMAASYDRERSLAVMKTGTSGPAGVTAIVLVLGLQVAALASLLEGEVRTPSFSLLSRSARRARPWRCAALAVSGRTRGRLRAHVHPDRVAVRHRPRLAVVAGALAGAGAWAGLPGGEEPSPPPCSQPSSARSSWSGPIRRFGGVTGDVFGAAVEAALATILVTLSTG